MTTARATRSSGAVLNRTSLRAARVAAYRHVRYPYPPDPSGASSCRQATTVVLPVWLAVVAATMSATACTSIVATSCGRPAVRARGRMITGSGSGSGVFAVGLAGLASFDFCDFCSRALFPTLGWALGRFRGAPLLDEVRRSSSATIRRRLSLATTWRSAD